MKSSKASATSSLEPLAALVSKCVARACSMSVGLMYSVSSSLMLVLFWGASLRKVNGGDGRPFPGHPR